MLLHEMRDKQIVEIDLEIFYMAENFIVLSYDIFNLSSIVSTSCIFHIQLYFCHGAVSFPHQHQCVCVVTYTLF